MKKKLLLMAAVMTASTNGFAQTSNRMEKVYRANNAAEMRIEAQVEGEKTLPVKAPAKKAYADNFYYTKPSGSLYRHWNQQGRGYGPTFMIVPAYEDIVFTPVSSTASTDTWSLEGSQTYDMTSYKDASYNLALPALSPNYLYGYPKMSTADGTSTFNFGSNSPYWSQDASNYPRVWVDSIAPVGFIDDHRKGYGWGSLSTGYLYGTGTMTIDDDEKGHYGTGTCVGVYQQYPKPVHSMYVENIFLPFRTDYATPLPEGKSLTLTITNLETEQVTKTLTASAGDITDFSETASTSSYSETGQYWMGTLVFADKVTDALGTVREEPFTINYPFSLTISGVDGEGVSIGFNGYEIQDEDRNDFMGYNSNNELTAITGRFVVQYPCDKNGDANTTTLYHYYRETVISPTFTAVMDTVIVANELYSYNASGDAATYSNANVFECPIAGGVGTCASTSLNYAYVQTAMDWFDENGDEMYYSDELPDWLTMTTTADEDTNGLYHISVTADALPSGTTGRMATLYIQGRGTTSTYPIIVTQGDISGINGVTVDGAAVSANSKAYNLNGQRVSMAAKGIVIKDGKKFINK